MDSRRSQLTRDVVVHTASGPEEVITNDVAVIYDLLVNSTDYGSGFLSHEDLTSLVRIGTMMGWKVPEDASDRLKNATPSERFLLVVLLPDGWTYVSNLWAWDLDDNYERAVSTVSVDALRDTVRTWLNLLHHRHRLRASHPTPTRLSRLRYLRVDSETWHLLGVGMEVSLGPPLEIPNMPVWPHGAPP